MFGRQARRIALSEGRAKRDRSQTGLLRASRRLRLYGVAGLAPPGFVPRAHGQLEEKPRQPRKQAGKKSETSLSSPLAQDLQHLAGGVEFAIDAAS